MEARPDHARGGLFVEARTSPWVSSSGDDLSGTGRLAYVAPDIITYEAVTSQG